MISIDNKVPVTFTMLGCLYLKLQKMLKFSQETKLESSKNIDIFPYPKFMEQQEEPLNYMEKEKMDQFLLPFTNTFGSSKE